VQELAERSWVKEEKAASFTADMSPGKICRSLPCLQTRRNIISLKTKRQNLLGRLAVNTGFTSNMLPSQTKDGVVIRNQGLSYTGLELSFFRDAGTRTFARVGGRSERCNGRTFSFF